MKKNIVQMVFISSIIGSIISIGLSLGTLGFRDGGIEIIKNYSFFIVVQFLITIFLFTVARKSSGTAFFVLWWSIQVALFWIIFPSLYVSYLKHEIVFVVQIFSMILLNAYYILVPLYTLDKNEISKNKISYDMAHYMHKYFYNFFMILTFLLLVLSSMFVKFDYDLFLVTFGSSFIYIFSFFSQNYAVAILRLKVYL